MEKIMLQLDLSGLACPMPIIKLKKLLAENPELVEWFEVQVSDPGALRDIPAYCRQQGLAYRLQQEAPVIKFHLRRVQSV